MKGRIIVRKARNLNISRDMARLWRNRWLELSQKDVPVAERLADAERPGRSYDFQLRTDSSTRKRLLVRNQKSTADRSVIGRRENWQRMW